jgi:hypothetical protein
MRQPDPIADYAALLARELAFDAPLSLRVRQEVEDHLWEAAAAGPGEATVEAQCRAIERFGDPRAIAAQYAPGSLHRQNRRTAALAVLVIAGTYLTMKGRVAWYELMHWTMDDRLREVIAAAMPVLRAVFIASALLGIVSWVYGVSRTAPRALDASHRRYLRWSQRLLAATTIAVGLMVSLDLAGTAARLLDAPWSVQSLVPLALMAAEIAAALALIVRLLGTIRRTTLAASLISDEELARPG